MSRPDQSVDLYRKVWELVRKNYLYRDRLADWDSWQHRFSDGTLEEATDASRLLLASLNDPHTQLIAPSRDLVAPQSPLFNPPDKSCSSLMLTASVGWLQIDSFASELLGEQLQRALAAVASSEALVIDLRGNGGGWIDPTVTALSLFIERGITHYTEFAGGNEMFHNITPGGIDREHIIAPTATCILGTLKRLPWVVRHKRLVVLVDETTASSAELFAAALRKHCGAYVIGYGNTVGKGILQCLEKLPFEMTMLLTYARWTTAEGEWLGDVGLTASRGLTPDKIVDRRDYGDPLEDAALEYLQQVLGDRVLDGRRPRNLNVLLGAAIGLLALFAGIARGPQS